MCTYICIGCDIEYGIFRGESGNLTGVLGYTWYYRLMTVRPGTITCPIMLRMSFSVSSNRNCAQQYQLHMGYLVSW